MRPDRATVLSVESLDNRILPALFDLTTAGASAAVNGAVFSQYTDTVTGDESPSFVRLVNDGTERGYNTNARPVQFHEVTGRAVNHAITVGQLPRRTVDGVDYREFVLNVNQTAQRPRLSVDQVQIFLGSVGNLRGYSNGQLAGLDPVYDMDAGGDNTVVVDARLSPGGRRTDDMVLLVPESVFADAGATADTFVYLYSRLGVTAGARANGEFEEWGIKADGGGAPVVPPPPPANTGSLSGRVYLDLDGLEGQGIDDVGVDVGLDELFTPVTITLAMLDGNGVYQDLATVTVNGDGFYTFADLQPGTYRITQSQPVGYDSVETEVGGLGGAAGTDGAGDFIGGIVVGSGQAGTDYNFQEVFVGG